MAGPDKINWLNDPIDPDSLGLGSIFGVPAARNALAPSGGLLGLRPAPAPAPNIRDILLGSLSANAGGPCRSRTSWNERFTHWERPESVTENGTIERAEANVSAAIAANGWLTAQGAKVEGQGSYFNRTNVRREADIDLRIVHPFIHVEYEPNVIVPSARDSLSYSDGALSVEQVFTGLRINLVKDLSARFGKANIEVGKKAIRIKGITGSRAEVDVVPSMRYHYVYWSPAAARYFVREGIAILSTDGRWTINYPNQHAGNGRAKRARTGHQFKRSVRIFKRMQADMLATGWLNAQVPSFLIECLVYAVEDAYFRVASDDRYSRVRRIAWRMREMLADQQVANSLTEINEFKWLFHDAQAWTHADALAFANAAVGYLGDA
jgi:hypothetical protein